MSILLKNCGQLIFSEDGKPKIGKNLSLVETRENVDLFIENGLFHSCGENLEVPKATKDSYNLIDCPRLTISIINP